MTEFKKGDLVRFRRDFNPQEDDIYKIFADEMSDYLGRNFTVTKIDNGRVYNNGWCFKPEWLELVPRNISSEEGRDYDIEKYGVKPEMIKMTEFKVGDIVKIKDGFKPEEHRNNDEFVYDMDSYIGQFFTVDEIDDGDVINKDWTFKPEWLELASRNVFVGEAENILDERESGQEESVWFCKQGDESIKSFLDGFALTGTIKAEGVKIPNSTKDGGGLRYNDGKTQLDLIPPFVIEQLGKVLTFGSNKYDRNNYRRGMKWSSVIDSLMRHINAFRAGEDFDPETGIYHIAHAICNLTFLLEYYRIYPQGDDRVQKYLEMPTVGLDVDDVLADTISYWCEYHKCEIPVWWNDNNFRKERFDSLYDNKDFWMNIPAKIKPEDLNFEPVCYVTSRSIPKEWTREWLIKNGFPDVELVSVGYGVSKVDAVKGKCDIFIDDRFDNFVELNRNGICCYLMDAPHNRRYNVGYKRITDIKNFLK